MRLPRAIRVPHLTIHVTPTRGAEAGAGWAGWALVVAACGLSASYWPLLAVVGGWLLRVSQEIAQIRREDEAAPADA